jgi:hypothetical protein
MKSIAGLFCTFYIIKAAENYNMFIDELKTKFTGRTGLKIGNRYGPHNLLQTIRSLEGVSPLSYIF